MNSNEITYVYAQDPWRLFLKWLELLMKINHKYFSFRFNNVMLVLSLPNSTFSNI